MKIFHNQLGTEMIDEFLKAGFDHPCRQTCSGWQQGFERGVSDTKKLFRLQKKLLFLLKIKICKEGYGK